jgi:hypothetical protein
LTVADKVTVAPATTEGFAGVTVTVVTTGGGGELAVTPTLAVPVFPELVAVMVAVPTPTAVTRPEELTVAMPELFVDHASGWSDITLPAWSFTIAARTCVASMSSDAVAGEMVTVVATGVGGA